MKEKKQNFFHGAAILALAGIGVKIIGACYKIPLGNLLGPVGMADFSIAYNIYALLFTLSTAGIPSAVSKMVSEAVAKGSIAYAGKIYRVSYITFASVGFAGFFIMFFGADIISAVMGSKSAALSIKAISPAVMFVCISSINRGYFQGYSNMYPTAISEILEAAGKLVFGIAAAVCIKKYGFDTSVVSAGAILGVSAGAFISALFFSFCREDGKKQSCTENIREKRIISELLRLTVPITAGAAIISLGNVIDSALVMNLLCDSGFSLYRAKWLFGAYNYATTLFNLPSMLTATLAVSAIPAISSALAKKDVSEISKVANEAMGIATTVAFPAAFGLYALSDEIMELLYGANVGLLCTEASAIILRYLCFGIPFLAIATVTNSIHQAMGKAGIPVISMLMGVAVKIVSAFILVRHSEINILGAAIGTFLCYGVIAFFNLIALKKYGIIKIRIINALIKPILPGIAAWAAAEYFSNITRYTFGLAFSTIFSVFMGFLACVVTAFSVDIVVIKDKKIRSGEESISKFFNND